MSIHEAFRQEFKKATGQESPWVEIGGYRLLGFENMQHENGSLEVLARVRAPGDADAEGSLYDSEDLLDLSRETLKPKEAEYLGAIAQSLAHRNTALSVIDAADMAPPSSEAPPLTKVMQSAESVLEKYRAQTSAAQRQDTARLAAQIATGREPEEP